ncbi:hypothetical protein [Flavobacterium aquicola]|uniref:Uncharacterized protein n=1 Tax=Flavobacterium aquicola TaxID=1682742 RepID=A0A3E0EQ03_9FLAO|nr:hypothetical protein [Flavobacterium aquicola]REG99449.1 hypothetical protein C8P67_10467 [Flavobacterium aquicola]
MELIKKTNEKLFLAMITEQCLRDIEDVDFLVVQLSMNKADIKKEFECAVSKMKNSINDFRMELASQIDQEYIYINGLLGDLEMELKDGSCRTNEMILIQMKNILKKLSNVENEIEKDIAIIKLACQFTFASFKVCLQFEILEKNLKKGKTVITAKYNDEIINAFEKTNGLIHKIPEKEKRHTMKWEGFMNEINTSYLHLKKAVHCL